MKKETRQIKAQPYLQAHCQSPTSQRHSQSFVKWSEAEFVNTLKSNNTVDKELVDTLFPDKN